MPDLCKHCGKPESEHCAFEAAQQCVCDCFASKPENAKPACKYFETFGTFGWCWNCGHDEACHKGKG